jgi:hypothetical protein
LDGIQETMLEFGERFEFAYALERAIAAVKGIEP